MKKKTDISEYIPINPFNVPYNVSSREWYNTITRAWCKTYGTSERGEYVFSHKMSMLYKNSGLSKADSDGSNQKHIISSRITFEKLKDMVNDQKKEEFKIGTKNSKWVFDLPMNTHSACSTMINDLRVVTNKNSMEYKLYGRDTGLSIGDIILPKNKDIKLVIPRYMNMKFRNFLISLYREYKILVKRGQIPQENEKHGT